MPKTAQGKLMLKAFVVRQLTKSKRSYYVTGGLQSFNKTRRVFGEETVLTYNQLARYFRKKLDPAGEEYLGAYQAWTDTLDDLEYVIVSIGSDDTPSQQKPTFAYGDDSGITESQVVTLNLDTSFNVNGVYAFGSVQYAPLTITSLPEWYPRIYSKLAELITHWLQSGKKVVLIDSHYPMNFSKVCKQLIEPHLEQLGSSFAFVHSYASCYPVALYSRAFYELGDVDDELESEAAKIIQSIFKPFSENKSEDVAQANQETEGFASVFASLDHLKITDLYPGNVLQHTGPPIAAGSPFHHPPVAGGVGDAADVNVADQGSGVRNAQFREAALRFS